MVIDRRDVPASTMNSLPLVNEPVALFPDGSAGVTRFAQGVSGLARLLAMLQARHATAPTTPLPVGQLELSGTSLMSPFSSVAVKFLMQSYHGCALQPLLTTCSSSCSRANADGPADKEAEGASAGALLAARELRAVGEVLGYGEGLGEGEGLGSGKGDGEGEGLGAGI